MNVFQAKVLRWFSAIKIMMPKSIPITSVYAQQRRCQNRLAQPRKHFPRGSEVARE
jgi:hypothetical protein